MAKSSSQTGTQKKATKALASELRKAGVTRKEALRLSETYLPGGSRYKSTESKLRSTLKGEEKYLPTSKNPYKGLEQFLPGGKNYQKPDFYKESQQGLKLAQKALAPVQEESLRQFQTSVLPSVATQFGGAEAKTSSALRQALSASATNLQSQLGSQLGQLAVGYGTDISHMNLAERARQQQLQYGATADIFNAQRAAQYGYGQEKRDIVSYLNQLGLGNANALQNAGIPGGTVALGVNPYMSNQKGGGVSPAGGIIAGGLGGAASGAAIGSVVPGIGTALGAGVGGLLGATGGYFSAR